MSSQLRLRKLSWTPMSPSVSWEVNRKQTNWVDLALRITEESIQDDPYSFHLLRQTHPWSHCRQLCRVKRTLPNSPHFKTMRTSTSTGSPHTSRPPKSISSTASSTTEEKKNARSPKLKMIYPLKPKWTDLLLHLTSPCSPTWTRLPTPGSKVQMKVHSYMEMLRMTTDRRSLTALPQDCWESLCLPLTAPCPWNWSHHLTI